MLTLPTTEHAFGTIERDDRAGYRPYRVRVSRIVDLSPSFRRITFTGPDLEYFAPHGLDQRIKLLLPVEGAGVSDIGTDDPEAVLAGTWYERWRALPHESRSPFRTYTVRRVRPQSSELDVDFVSHGDGGPAAKWLASATVGDELVIVGPDVRSIHSATGIDWHPGSARELLLAGDETATPAICSILESLPAGTRARAFIQIPSFDDALEIETAADVEITWLVTGLEDRLRAWAAENREVWAPALSRQAQELADIDVDLELLWDSPEDSTGEFYAWLAGESALIKSLRRLLVTELGIDRKRVAFMGYWRLGKSEAQE